MKQSDYYNRQRFILSVCKKPVKLLVGTIVYIYLLARKKNTHYLILPHEIGDSVWALAYLEEYKRQHGYEHVTIVCTNNIKKICEFWKGTFEDVICVDRKAIKGLWEIPHTIWGEYLYTFAHRDRITFAYYTCYSILRNYWGSTAYGIDQLVKQLMFQINSDSEVQYPDIPYADICSLVERYGLVKEKTVLLNSVRCDASGLFEKATEILVREGYKVFTLTTNEDDKPVKGTLPIPCNLVEAYWLSKYCGTVIALRSGFLDLMIFAQCRIISVVDKNYGSKDFYRLERWGINRDCHTVECGDNDVEAVGQILNIMNLSYGGRR